MRNTLKLFLISSLILMMLTVNVYALDGGTYHRAWFKWHAPNSSSPLNSDSHTDLDFESDDYPEGFLILTYTDTAPNPIRKNWAPYLADASEDGPGVSELAVIAVENDNKYLDIDTYFMCICDYYLTGDYVYSLDVKADSGITGIFARGSVERLYYDESSAPVHYTSADSDGYIGSTGIAVYPQQDKKVRVVVKSADDTNIVKNTMFEFPIEADFKTEFVNVKIANTSERINIYINDVCICKIVASDIKTYGSSSVTYYSKAIVTDSAGNELGTVENARIATESEIVFCSYDTHMCVDNLKLLEYTEDKDPGFTKSVTGVKVVKSTPAPATPSPSPSIAITPSPAPTSAPTQAKQDTNDTEESSSLVPIIAISVGVVAIAAIVAVIIIKKKKRK